MGKKRSLCGALVALAGLAAGAAQAQETQVLPAIDVWASRTGAGISGASTSVITAEDIARSPGATLQEVLSQEAGIQTISTSGGKNGAGTTVDLRGFGATAVSNTLVLLNGRRLTDIDLSGIDFSTIPRDSIQRIEITRGNSGAVLYGDGAVGGVINIVTKTGVAQPPSGRVEAGYGSFNQRELNASALASHGAFSVSAFGNAVNSDGYRVNDYVRQRNAVGDLRYTGEEGSAWFNISGDDQHLGLPGARLVDPSIGVNELATDRQGATTPNAFSSKTGASLTFGASRMIGSSVELIVDGNLRRKDQTVFSSLFGFDTSDVRGLTSGSVTPRANINTKLFGAPTKITTGVDYYNSSLDAKRSMELSDPPYHTYNLKQQAAAVYWQQTVSVLPTTDVSFGGRLQQTWLSARDRYDAAAPGSFGPFDTAATPLDSTDTQHALHLGFEHRFSPMFSVFGRVARSFRTPNVDERIGVNAFPVDFNLKTQTSRDIEGGVRGHIGALEWQSSVYAMQLDQRNHVHSVSADRRQHQSRSDAPRRRREQRDAAAVGCAAPEGRPDLYARHLPRGALCRQRRSAGVALDRQSRPDLGHLPETRRVRRGRALCRRAAHGQRSGEFPAADPCAHHRRSPPRRRDEEPVLVGGGAEPV